MIYQLFLIFTPECIIVEGKEEEGVIKKDTMERIERFSMLVARPVGVVVFLMGGKDGGGGGGMREYLIFLNW